MEATFLVVGSDQKYFPMERYDVEKSSTNSK